MGDHYILTLQVERKYQVLKGMTAHKLDATNISNFIPDNRKVIKNVMKEVLCPINIFPNKLFLVDVVKCHFAPKRDKVHKV